MKTLLKIFILYLFATIVHANEIRFMTYNIASLPTIFGKQIENQEYLKPNLERANEITKVINQWNTTPQQGVQAPQVIAFEEAFDLPVRSLLKEKLSSYYPYNSGEYGQKLFNAGSGLFLFSQYPILEITFHPYTNMMAGEEWLANKGFITAKLKYNDQYFITVILTHLEAGGAIFKDEQSKLGTTSERRGVQMGEINDELMRVASYPPKGYSRLKYLKSFVMGDMNATLDSERQQKSISTGLSDNGFKEGQIKYPGQYALFTTLKNMIPTDFFEVRVLPKHKGEGKRVDPELLAEAAKQNDFTGSTIPVDILKNNKNKGQVITRQQTENKIIDAMTCTYTGIEGNFESNIISLNEYTSYPFSLSDHLPLIGRFNFTLQ